MGSCVGESAPTDAVSVLVVLSVLVKSSERLLMMCRCGFGRRVFRGMASVAMIYDIKPISDRFRLVDDDDDIMGAMDCPKLFEPELGTFYLFLTRRKDA